MNIKITPNPEYPAANLDINGKKYPAVVGREGVTDEENKKEGDWKTPVGKYKILGGYHRADHVERPESTISFNEIEPDDIWVDDLSSPYYNQPAKISDIEDGVSHEKLWREDHLYDLVLDLDYNRRPAIAGKGSAIFMHVARDQENPANTPTAGCVALARENLLQILSEIDPETEIEISD